MNPKLIADGNLHILSLNTYPGRGIFMGQSEDAQAIYLGCWTMGRSSGSRNRVYTEGQEGRLFTEVANPSLEKSDPETTLYNAMREVGSVFVVSNGRQTDPAVERAIDLLDVALTNCPYDKYEPDSPIYTPRITGRLMFRLGKPFYEFSILRKSPWGDECDRLYFQYDNFAPGFGRCVTTYMNDGNPPPHWQGEPYLVPLRGTADKILQEYWGSLNEANRVSCAVKRIPLDGDPSTISFINKNVKT